MGGVRNLRPLEIAGLACGTVVAGRTHYIPSHAAPCCPQPCPYPGVPGAPAPGAPTAPGEQAQTSPAPTPEPSPTEQAAAAGGETFASAAPNMVGHLLLASRSIDFRYNRAAGPVNVANNGQTSIVNAAGFTTEPAVSVPTFAVQKFAAVPAPELDPPVLNTGRPSPVASRGSGLGSSGLNVNPPTAL